MRHGRTRLNAESRTVGSIDDPLIEIGREQACLAGAEFVSQGIRFGLIVSSKLARAKETAEIVAEVLGGMMICFDDRLRERCVGVREGQLEEPDDDEKLLDPNGPQPEGAEPYWEFDARVMDMLMELQEGATTVRSHILLVTHGLWTVHALKFIRGWNAEETHRHVSEIPGNCDPIRFLIGSPCPECKGMFYEV